MVFKGAMTKDERDKILRNLCKTGRWINGEYWSEGCGMGETYGYYYKCSECGAEEKGGYEKCGYNFCPMCGAKMEGAEE